MTLACRLWIAAGCLGLAVMGQYGLGQHLRAARELPAPSLTRDLAEFPQRVAGPDPSHPTQSIEWLGEDDPSAKDWTSQIRFADALIARVYRRAAGGSPLHLYMVHSKVGADRRHDPEICIREFAGAAEDLRGRKTVYLDPERTRPVQRFRFLPGTGNPLTIYYWHYTLRPETPADQSLLQALHTRLGRPVASVTCQLAITEPLEEPALEWLERTFLVAVDQAMRERHLPPGARIGCDRLPIKVIRD